MRPVLVLSSVYASYLTLWVYHLGTSPWGVDLSTTVSATFSAFSQNVLENATRYLDLFLFSPMTVFGSRDLVAFAYAASVGLAIFPLYALARAKLGFKMALLSVGVLIFYLPLWGTYPWTFDLSILFPTFFLFGYYFLEEDRPWVATGFFVLAGESHYPYFIVIALFGALLLGTKAFGDHPGVGIALIGLTGVYLAANLLVDSTASTGTVQNPLALNDLATIAFTVSVILAPVLYIPLLSKWVVMLAPFGALVVLSDYSTYSGWGLFTSAHTTLFSPFIVLGLIDVLVWSHKFRVLLLPIVFSLGLSVALFLFAPFNGPPVSQFYAWEGIFSGLS